MSTAFRPKGMAAQATLLVAPGPVVLGTVNVNTGAASSVVTLYDALTAVTGKKFATIDASSKSCQFYGVFLETGLCAVMSGGDSDVTFGIR